MRNLGIFALLGVALLAPTVARADVVTDWNEIAIDVGRRLALGSNRTTRVLAITHLAVYDAVESVTHRYDPYRKYATLRSSEISIEAAVAQAAHDALLWLNPTDYARLDAELERSLSGIVASASAKANGIELGRAVASQLVYERLADGSSDVETYDLTIPPDPSAGGSGSGGATGAGGSSSGGALGSGGALASGGASGGSAAGGSSSGGVTASGGAVAASNGGVSNGGDASGGAASGGTASGGAASGGSGSGGTGSGGASKGGASGGPVNPIPGAGLWRPTPRAPVSGVEPAGAAALEPQWRGVTPFAILSPSAFRSYAPAPPALVDQGYTDAYEEVKSLGAFASTTRTAEQTDIANFWRQETQVPFNAIARSVALQKGLSVEQNARLFALLNVALADVRIAVWDIKYLRGFWRPITAIRLAERDGNPSTSGDATWRPLLETPAHPSYVSGHSATGAAGAAVLAALFGDVTSFSVASDTLLGKVRSFSSFSSAAQENADSRIYGGIHFRFDNDKGLALGKAVGDYVASQLLLPAPDGAGGAGGGAGGAGGVDGVGGSGIGGEGASAGETGAAGSGLGGAPGTGGGTASGGVKASGGVSSGGLGALGGQPAEAGSAGVGGKTPNDGKDDDGCSCSIPGQPSRSSAPWGLAAIALFAWKRRLRRKPRG